MRATATWLWPKILSVLETTSPTSRPMMASTTRISRSVNAPSPKPRRGMGARAAGVSMSGFAGGLVRRRQLAEGAAAADFIGDVLEALGLLGVGGVRRGRRTARGRGRGGARRRQRRRRGRRGLGRAQRLHRGALEIERQRLAVVLD